ncbi:hypothetical protein HK098_005775 [Nowakowskiella sp. JEL0407]|nr:hypothetical protein HK098_005775 [Nowakowskiella sp. JEL0407]
MQVKSNLHHYTTEIEDDESDLSRSSNSDFDDENYSPNGYPEYQAYADDDPIALTSNPQSTQNNLDNGEYYRDDTITEEFDFESTPKYHVDPVKLACISTYKLNLERNEPTYEMRRLVLIQNLLQSIYTAWACVLDNTHELELVQRAVESGYLWSVNGGGVGMEEEELSVPDENDRIEEVRISVTDTKSSDVFTEPPVEYVQVFVEQSEVTNVVQTYDEQKVEIIYGAQVEGDVVSVVPEQKVENEPLLRIDFDNSMEGDDSTPIGSLATKLAIAKPIDSNEAKMLSSTSLNLLLTRSLPALPQEAKELEEKKLRQADGSKPNPPKKKKKKEKERRSSVDVIKNWLPGLFNNKNGDRPPSPVSRFKSAPSSPTLSFTSASETSLTPSHNSSDSDTLRNTEPPSSPKQAFSEALKSRLRPFVPRGSPEPTEEVYNVLTSTPSQWSTSPERIQQRGITETGQSNQKPIFKRPTLKTSVFKKYTSPRLSEPDISMAEWNKISQRGTDEQKAKRRSSLSYSITIEDDIIKEMESVPTFEPLSKSSSIGSGSSSSSLRIENGVLLNPPRRMHGSSLPRIRNDGYEKPPARSDSYEKSAPVSVDVPSAPVANGERSKERGNMRNYMEKRKSGRILERQEESKNSTKLVEVNSLRLPELKFTNGSLLDDCDLLIDDAPKVSGSGNTFDSKRSEGSSGRRERRNSSRTGKVGGMVGESELKTKEEKKNEALKRKSDVFDIGIDVDWIDATLNYAGI